MSDGTTRREFLAGTAAAAGATLVAGTASAGETFPLKRGGVVLGVTHPGATQAVTKNDDAIIRRMVNEALQRFTGAADPGQAMARFFTKEDVVGVKINTLGSPHASVNRVTAFAIADALHARGIPKQHIIIYDQYGSRMRKAGFKPLWPGHTAKDGEYPVHNHKTLGYETADTAHAGLVGKKKRPGASKLPKLLQQLTAVVNVCVPKDHDLTGVTGALKNVAYGNIDYVPRFHCRPECTPTCQYDGKCNVARIYSHPRLGGKVRLVICDAVRVLYHGGPQDKPRWRAAHNSMLIGTDPVAMDRIIHELVDTYRKQNKMKPVAEDRAGRRAPRFIEGAAALGLGEADRSKIRFETVTLS